MAFRLLQRARLVKVLGTSAPRAAPATTVARAGLCDMIREPTVVGLSADPDARGTLKSLYQETLAAIGDMPDYAAYKRNVKAITEYRLGVVEGTEDVDVIEARLGIGQIEEVIEQARDELELIPHMARWAPWGEEDAAKAKIEVLD